MNEIHLKAFLYEKRSKLSAARFDPVGLCDAWANIFTVFWFVWCAAMCVNFAVYPFFGCDA